MTAGLLLIQVSDLFSGTVRTNLVERGIAQSSNIPGSDQQNSKLQPQLHVRPHGSPSFATNPFRWVLFYGDHLIRGFRNGKKWPIGGICPSILRFGPL